MRIRLIITTLLLLASVGTAQTTPSGTWEPLRSFVGIWEGTGNGQPGVSKIQREYRLGSDELIEVFEIAEPGKDFELYSEGHFRRKE